MRLANSFPPVGYLHLPYRNIPFLTVYMADILKNSEINRSCVSIAFLEPAHWTTNLKICRLQATQSRNTTRM